MDERIDSWERARNEAWDQEENDACDQPRTRREPTERGVSRRRELPRGEVDVYPPNRGAGKCRYAR